MSNDVRNSTEITNFEGYGIKTCFFSVQLPECFCLSLAYILQNLQPYDFVPWLHHASALYPQSNTLFVRDLS